MVKEFKSFLIINPFGIGDVVFSTPLIANLKDQFPQAKIFYLCNKKVFPILKNHPFIEKVFVYERDEFVQARNKSWRQWLKKFQQFIAQIQKEKIDICLDLSLNTQYSFFAWTAGIKKRYGLDYKNRCWFLNRKIKIAGFTDKHVADYYLDVLKLLDLPIRKFGLQLFPDIESKKQVKKFCEEKNITGTETIIGIAPCGGDAFGKDADIKRWPAENFSSLIDKLIEEFKIKIFLFAGPKEKQDIQIILSKVKNKSAVYEFTESSLAETLAVVERCNLFISNDTGPMRFADALNKKIIALFGPVDEKVYGPYPYDEKRTITLKKDLVCRPCYNKFRLSPCVNNKKCLTEITVTDILSAIKSIRGQASKF